MSVPRLAKLPEKQMLCRAAVGSLCSQWNNSGSSPVPRPPHRRRNPLTSGRRESGQALVMLLIVLAIVAAGFWYMSTARSAKEQEARAFASEVADRVVLR